jgi:hypothetical protein
MLASDWESPAPTSFTTRCPSSGRIPGSSPRASRATCRFPKDEVNAKKRVRLRIGPFDADRPDLLLVLVLVIQQVAGLGIMRFGSLTVLAM